MNPIDEIQKSIVADFDAMGDPFDQYAYLIELSCAFQPMAPENKKPELLVEGCQSHVWLDTSRDENGLFRFETDSDTLIVKGVLYLLQKCFCGQRPEDVASSTITFLAETMIMVTFDDDRQKGIGYVIKQLQKSAAEMAG